MKLERLNPSLKAGTVLLSVILLSFQYLVSLNTAVFVICIFLLLFFSDARPRQIAVYSSMRARMRSARFGSM